MAVDALTVRSKDSATKTESIFLTPESLTFPGVSAVAFALLQLADSQFDGARTSFWWALGICAFLGVGVIAFSTTPGTSFPKALFIGVVNILLLTASALGVSSLAANSPPTT